MSASTNGNGAIDYNDVLRFTRLLMQPNDVIEVRALNAESDRWRTPHTISGYFNDPELLVKALPYIRTATGTYITLNPALPDVWHRAANRLKDCKKDDQTTANVEITTLRWLPIDVDAIRPSGISSTDTEHDYALAIAQRISANLQAEGWPEPISGDSGNGGHLLWRVDLDLSSTLIRDTLQALARRYDDALIHVDQTVFNPARIWKLYGTWVRKGDNTPERPHRLARVLAMPDVLSVVSADQLQALITAYPPPVTTSPTNTLHPAFDLEDWIRTYLPEAEGPTDWPSQAGKGRKWVLPVCPWDSTHTGRKFSVCELGNGAITAGCQHASCNHDWKELRQLKEPGYSNGTGGYTEADTGLNGQLIGTPILPPTPGTSPPRATAPPPRTAAAPRTLPHIYTADDALQPQPPIEWAIDGLLAQASTAVIFGQPGSKKTWSCLDLAVCVAQGTPWLDTFATTQSAVLLIDEESGPRRLLRRLGDVIRGHQGDAALPIFATSLAGFNFWTNNPQADSRVLQTLIEAVGAKLVIIDALADVMLGGDENTVKDAQPVFHALRTVAENTNAAIIVIHHGTKIGSGYRGSTAIAGAVDLLLEVTSKPDDTVVTFETAKARDTDPQKFSAECDWGTYKFNMTGCVTGAAVNATPNYTKGERTVLVCLARRGDKGTNAEIEMETHYCAGTVRNIVAGLMQKGVLNRIDGGGSGTPGVYQVDPLGLAALPL